MGKLQLKNSYKSLNLNYGTVKLKRLFFLSLLALGAFVYWVEIKFVIQDGYIILKDYFSTHEEELSDFISWDEVTSTRPAVAHDNLSLSKHQQFVQQWNSSQDQEFDNLMAKFQAQSDYYYEDPICPIPRSPLMPQFMQKTWKPHYQLDCSFELNTATLENDQVLKRLPDPIGENQNLQCCVQEILRKTDFKYRLTACQKFDDVLEVGKREVLAIKCNDSINFEANIPIKPKVQQKLSHWDGIPMDERPYNILIFGMDTTSRLHAIRSLPKSMELMKKLGFIDFKSYHSVFPATLPNFMAFLMGIPARVNRIPFTCSKSYMSPFDKCPFIWKNFTEANYITNYMEDGTQTFNFKMQGGFEKPPTDYYVPHLFLALQQMREVQEEETNRHQNVHFNTDDNSNGTTQDVLCTSKETVPEFILRYAQRFARKFANYPFFSFSWINKPFHDNYQALSFMDKPVQSFLRSIMTQPEVLDRTFIIYLSDHGDRYTEFSVNSFESFFERVLPPLFIRVPDHFKRKFPSMAANFLRNSYRFVTPYDVHHTMLHLLSMGQSSSSGTTHPTKEQQSIFRTVKKTKASLFAPLPPHRNCESAKIQESHCKCNVPYENDNEKMSATTIDVDSNSNRKSQNENNESERLHSTMLAFIVKELNFKVQNSIHGERCQEWSSNVSQILSVHKTQRGERLLTFTAEPSHATFQANVKLDLVDVVKNGKSSDFKFQLLAINRVSAYGDQSWCITLSSDVDKEMKNFCYCKEKPPSEPPSVSTRRAQQWK